MGNQNDSVIPVIEKWETFKREYPQKDIYAFGQWIVATQKNEQRTAIAKPIKSFKNIKSTSEKISMNNDATAAVQITRLERYLGFYIKPSLKKLGFTKQHEYAFLLQIHAMDNPSKKELSEQNLTELSTGRDVIRRLIARGLVTEKINPEDKRASQLGITDKGKKILVKSHELISTTFKNFLGDLSSAEQKQLIGLLQRLNDYHAAISDLNLLPNL